MISVTIDHYLIVRTHLFNLENLRVGIATLPAVLFRCVSMIMCSPLHIVNLPDEVVIVEFSLELVFCHLIHTLTYSLRVDPVCVVCNV